MEQNGLLKAAKRYGPFVGVAVVVVAAIAVFGGGGDDDEPDAVDGDSVLDNEELIRSGPMTPQKAELEGEEDVDFGPNCDPETGRIKLPMVYAPQCVAPFEGDNGGATSMGVTEDEILIVRYDADPALDPLFAAQISMAGADPDPELIRQTNADYAAVFQEVFETYGRTVRVENYLGTGPGDDAEAARADAIAIAEMRPFAVVGGPNRMGPVFATELAEREVLCVGTCPVAVPEETTLEYQPHILPTGHTPDQAVALASELIGNLAGPGPAELAGDPALQEQDRAYALLHYDTADGDHEGVAEAFHEELAERGIELPTDIRFELDLARAQENARTYIAQLQSAEVTTIVYYGDPLTLDALTTEATAQDYFPEWILGPNALADTNIFGRTYDQEQWVNGFGIGLAPEPGIDEIGPSYRIYDWAYGTEPPSNIYAVIEPSLRTVFTGIQLAGPELTPETFRQGLFRALPSGGTPTAQHVSRGDHGVWPDLDVGGLDDAAIIWWDSEAEGRDEAGNEGVGMYRFANGGERYTLGNFPTTAEEAGLFDEETSVTVYEEPHPDSTVPDYPPPDL
jgi:hypothetical protein